MKNHTISTVMAVYNGGKFIAEAIDSIMAQTLPSNEIIIINDGSTDNTLSILNKYPTLKVISSQQNLGQWKALNQAIQLTTGNYLNFIDADDLWHVSKNQMQLDHLTTKPNLDMSFCHLQQFTQTITGKIYAKPQKAPTQLGLFIKKEKFMSVGMFGDKFKAESILWFQKAKLMNLQSECLDDVLAYRRSHSDNLTRKVEYNQELASLAYQLILQRNQHTKHD